MIPYKIIGRKVESTASWHYGQVGRQVKKRVYVSEEDYKKYAPDTIMRWAKFCKLKVEAYKMVDNKWVKVKI